ncbi:hypothetical protein KUC3_18490 [Alteromonas sp. KC3]|nr:hypothetical protein KUC3_18490 [Alteromonas sp. KC3]BCO22950.1 hypothetical protein KUC14_18190 [Alteromonas sp. KC14]
MYNKKIKSCAGAHWDAYTWAASHISPRECAPYLKVMCFKGKNGIKRPKNTAYNICSR